MKNKYVLITGASNGIGFELSRFFLEHEDHVVFAFARNAGKLEELQKNITVGNSKNLILVPGDITNENDVARLFTVIKNETSRLDIIVNNAGTLINRNFLSLSSADWQSIYLTNVFSIAGLIRVLYTLLERNNFSESERSHILNIASMGGFQGSQKFPGLSAYSSSKAALVCLSECLAEEFRAAGISVNCLALGSVQTPMFEKAFPGLKAATSPAEMARFIGEFAISGHHHFNGKVLPVSVSTP